MSRKETAKNRTVTQERETHGNEIITHGNKIVTYIKGIVIYCSDLKNQWDLENNSQKQNHVCGKGIVAGKSRQLFLGIE